MHCSDSRGLPLTRIRAAAHAAFITMRWATLRHGQYAIASEEVLAGLEHAYRLGYKHARSDAAQAVGELLADHELPEDILRGQK